MSCQICFDSYNNSDHKPYVITSCGHTFCCNCLNSLSDRLCPTCRKLIRGKQLNFALLEMIDSKAVDSRESEELTGKLDKVYKLIIIFYP